MTADITNLSYTIRRPSERNAKYYNSTAVFGFSLFSLSLPTESQTEAFLLCVWSRIKVDALSRLIWFGCHIMNIVVFMDYIMQSHAN